MAKSGVIKASFDFVHTYNDFSHRIIETLIDIIWSLNESRNLRYSVRHSIRINPTVEEHRVIIVSERLLSTMLITYLPYLMVFIHTPVHSGMISELRAFISGIRSLPKKKPNIISASSFDLNW